MTLPPTMRAEDGARFQFLRERKLPYKKVGRSLRLSEHDVDARFGQRPTNIGVHLGEASDELVDVDLDCAEACDIAPTILPSTNSVFGRRSSQHRTIFIVARSTPSVSKIRRREKCWWKFDRRDTRRFFQAASTPLEKPSNGMRMGRSRKSNPLHCYGRRANLPPQVFSLDIFPRKVGGTMRN